MKSVKAVMIAALLAFGPAKAFAEELTIRWGTEAGYKPFMYKDTGGKLVGFDYDIGNAICEELKAKCSWVEQDWDGLIPGLIAERYDAILASMTITEERKRIIDFTIPYYKMKDRLVSREGAIPDDGDGLAGKVVGVQRGTTNGNYLMKERPDVTVREYPSQEEVWLDLAAGRIDAGFARIIVISDGFLKTDAGKGFAMFGKVYDDPKYFGDGAGIAMRKDDTATRDKINGAIEALHANGTYAKISAKYFDFDVWGR